MKFILKLFFVFLLSLTGLFASQKQADYISKISSSSLYNIDKKSLQRTVNAYIENHPNLEALKVVEELSGETYIEFFKENGKIIYKPFSNDKIQNSQYFKATSFYNGEVVGKIFAYFKNQELISLTKEEKKWLSNNKIVLSVDDNYAPMNFKNFENEMNGLSIDYIKLIEKKIGYSIKLDANSWPISLSNAMTHKSDGIINANSTSERDKKLIFTDPYISVPMVLLTSSKTKNYHSLSEIRNKTILVKRKTVEASVLPKKYPNLRIKEVDSYKDALIMLSSDKADGVFGHMAVLEYEKNKYLISNIKRNLVSFNDIITKQSIGIRNTAPLLQNIINKAISSISKEQKKSINEKWMEPVVKDEENLSQIQVSWLKQNPSITLAVVDNYPPYDFRNDNNKLAGFHTDLINIINKNLGIKINLKPFESWSKAYNSALNGNVNGILSLSWSKEREEKYFNYTSPYHFSPYHLVIKEDSIFSSLDDLANKKIAVEKDTIFKDIIEEKVPSADILFVKNTKSAYESVQSGESLATISPNISDTLFKNSNLKIATEIHHKSSNLYIGVNKKYPIVNSILTKGVDSVSLEDITKLRQKWFTKTNAIIELNESEKNWIKKNPEVKVIKFFDEPPFTLNTDKKSGYVYELIEYLIESAGLKINYIDGFKSYGEMIGSLEKGESDILTTFPTSLNLGEESKITKSKSILKTPFILISKANNGKINSLKDLYGQKVAVVKGYVQDKYLSSFPQIEKLYVNNNKEGFEALRTGKANYYINNKANSDYILNKSFSTDLKIVYEMPYTSFPPLSISFAMNGEKEYLVSILNKALEQIPYKKIKDIREKWIVDTEVNKQIKISFSKKEEEFLTNNKEIVLGADQNWQPFDFRDNFGKHSGFNADYLDLIQKKLGVKIKVELGEWSKLQKKVENRELAGLIGPTKTIQRDKYMEFTDPYFMLSQVILSRSNSAVRINSLHDLKNKTIAVKSGSSNINYLKENYPDIKRKILNTNGEVIRAVSLGEVDFGLSNIGAASYEMEKNFISNIKVAYEINDLSGDMRFGVRKDWPELASIIQKAIDSITREEINTIFFKWLKLTASPTSISKLEFTKEEKQWLENNPNIRIAYMNYWTTDDNEENIHTQYAGLLSKYGNINISLVKYDSWKNGFDSAKKGKDTHGILNLSWDKNREANSFNYTKPYFFTPGYLIVKKSNNSIKSIEDLANKNIYLKEKAITNQIINDLKYNITPINLKNENEIHKALGDKDSKADALLTYINDSELLDKYNLKVANKFFTRFGEVHLGISKNQNELYSILNKIYNVIPKSELSRIQNKVYKKSKKIKIDLTKEEKDFIKKHPKIRIHNEKDWAPYNFYEKGRARGLSIDYIKTLARKAGLDIEFVTGPSWNEFMTMSKNKEIDVMLNIVKSPKREEFLNFTEPYSELLQSLYIKRGEKAITSTKELFGKTFAVPKGFYYEEELKKYPQIKVLKLNNTLECIQAVSFGKADAMLDLTLVVDYYKSKHRIDNVVRGGTLGWEGGSLPLRIGVRNDWPELVSILNKSLESLSDKELDELEDKWIFGNTQTKIKLIPLTEEEKKWIKENVVKIGIEEWAPIIFSHGGKDYDGITGDVLRLIVERTGLNLEVVNDLWDPLLTKFKNKELDLLPATYYTDERATYGLYSDGYYKMLDYIYVREDNNEIRSLKDLIGKTLAIPKGFGTIPKIKKKFPGIIIVETRDLSDSMQRVLRGEVDALYDGQIAVDYKTQEDLIVGLKGIPQKDFSAAPLHFFSNTDKPILRDILNKALKSIPVYEINKIKSKWLIEKRSERIIDSIESKKSDEETWWLIIAGISLFILLLFIFLIATRYISNDFIAKSFGSTKFRIAILIFLSIVICLLAILVSITLSKNKQSTLHSTKSDLEFVLKTTQNRLDTWMEERKNFLLQVGRDAHLVKLTEELLKVQKDSDSLRQSQELKKIRKFFDVRKREFGTLGFFIIDKDFISVASKRDTNIGTKNLIANKHPRLLEKVFKGETVFIPPIESDVSIKSKKSNEHTMFFAIPIQNEDGDVIAAMTQRLDVEGKFSNIIQSGRLGQSGESYLFSKDGFMLTKSRFRDDLIKIGLLKPKEKEYEKIQIKDPGGSLIEGFKPNLPLSEQKLTKMAEQAIALDNKTIGMYSKVYSDIDGYRDYRGVNVFGAWVWYNEYGFGLTTEVDVEEALIGYYVLRQNLLIITILTLLLTILATVMLIILGEKSTKSVQKANKDLNKLLSSFDENVIASKTDLKGFITYASKAFCEISGYTEKELIGSPQNIVRHPDMPKEIFKDLWKTIKNGKTWRGEVKNKKKEGGYYWVEVVINPELDDEGKITGYSAIRQDITSKKEVEDLSRNLELKVEERTSKLKESEQRFIALFDAAPDSIILLKDGGIIDCNQKTLEIFGVKSRKEFREINFNDLSPEYQDNEIKSEILSVQLLNKAISKGFNQFEWKHKRIDNNKLFDAEVILAPIKIDNEINIYGVVRDISERKELEKQIQENQEQMTFVSQYANFGFWNFNPQIGDLFVNDIFVQMLGYDSEEVLMNGFENKMFKPFKDGLAFWEKLLHPDDVEHTNKAINAHIAGETELYKVDYRMRKYDGSWMWSTAIGRIAEYDKDGKPIRFNGVNIDIDESKKAQQAITDQKQYIDSIMNSQSNIVISTDGEKLRTANKAFFDFYEIKDVNEFLETLGDCICDTFDTTAPKEFVQKMMGEEKWIEYVYSRPNQIHKAIIERDGKKHIFTITSDRFEFAGEVLEVAVFTDITEIESIRKNIETILSNIMLPVLITSKKDRKILYANDYASIQYETKVENLIGSSIDSVYTSLNQKDEILNIMSEQGYVENLEERYKTRAGKEFIGLLSVKPITYNNEEAYIGMVVDITKQKEIEEEIRQIHKHTQSSIEYASLIQHSLIPSNDSFKKYFDDYFTIWHPKDIVGGDIYLFEELRNEDECLLMLIDCTGHGVPGAFVTMLVKAIERQIAAIVASDANMEVSPAWILKYFNQTMKKLLKQEDDDAISNAGFDGTVLYYNKKDQIVKFAGAELPLFYIEDNEFKIIKGNRHSIGYKKSDGDYEFKEHIIQTKPGMQFYLTTDGYVDQNGGEKGFPFGKKRFQKLIEEYQDYSFADQQEVLLNELQDYQKDEERNDDITIVGVKIAKENNRGNNSSGGWTI